MTLSSLRRPAGRLLAAAFALSTIVAAARAAGAAAVGPVRGDVTIVRGDSGVRVSATLDTPVLPGDCVDTASGSSAEVRFDSTSSIRLAESTQLRVVSLDPSEREVQLASGTAEFAVTRAGDAASQIDTPSATVRPVKPGDYRISVLADGQTLVTVRSGMATVSSGNSSVELVTGSTLGL